MSWKGRTCYYCGLDATSLEHVPPRCIFPEYKDSFGVDYRRNLITVPSCDKHNLRKSKDDEFLMATITPVVGNNFTGYIQTRTKLRRSFTRRNQSLLKAVMSKVREGELVTQKGLRFPVLVGQPDVHRLCHVLEHVARGLYFHIHGSRFIGRCIVLPSFVRFDNPDLEFIKKLARLMVHQEGADWITRGENPKVFSYRLGAPDQFGLIAMVMRFFGGAEVYITFQPEGIELPFRGLSEATADNPIKITTQIKKDDGVDVGGSSESEQRR